MSIPVAYAVIIVVWSTTPLAIKWSAEGLSPVSGVFLRMLIATCVGYLFIRMTKRKLRWDKEALQYYATANLGLFFGLLLIYKASTFVASGLISVLFGLSPILSGLLAHYILDDAKFSGRQWGALLFAVSGLAIVFSDQLSTGGSFSGDHVALGLALILTSVFLFSFSGVLMTKLDVDMDSMSAVVGSLITALPLFFIAWAVADGTIHFSNISLALPSIIYLGVGGSLIGFACYFYILQKTSATYASTVTLITPVIALFLGSVLNGEVVTVSVGVGASFICLGLFLFLSGGAAMNSKMMGDSD
ncbi:MAG: DMT family transporter [Pseudomonadales bacterium]|nr:DMT family transporter [Pseudomonadales bacterium]